MGESEDSESAGYVLDCKVFILQHRLTRAYSGRACLYDYLIIVLLGSRSRP